MPFNENSEMIIDPRRGDVDDDASSPRHRSLIAIAGSLLVEMNLVKLVLAVVIIVVLPAVLLGLAPLVATGLYRFLSRGLAEALFDVVPFLSLVLVLVLAWFGGRPLYRATERSFWSLISLLVQPGYALFRESLRHLGERLVPVSIGPAVRARLGAVATAGAGLLLCVLAVWAVYLVWPYTRWSGDLTDLRFPQRMILPTLANSVVIVGLFLALASLVWSLADATMEQPRDLDAFDPPPAGAPVWRVAQISDLHVVGSPYEFRLESGRSGPRGNDRVHRTLERLAAVHAKDPLDLVLMSGDMTDAGRSTEWAVFLAALAQHPALADRILILPGNHDLNVVDRANPARLELPTGTRKCLRQMRALSAIAAVQGNRVLVQGANGFDTTLSAALEPYHAPMREFADRGGFRLARKLGRLWDDLFPMVAPPRSPDGLGVILLNSNAEAHFSFTNALGLVPATQASGMAAAVHAFPQARWIVALHHHVVEYPKRPRFADRIGTALVNGSAFVRQLRPLGERAVVMHGHRHIEWVGACGPTRIISAPSPVMGPGPDAHFYMLGLAPGPDGHLALLQPEYIGVQPGEDERWAGSRASA